jgi:hypothetical protein
VTGGALGWTPAVQFVLDGTLSYDELATRQEQAAVRAEWIRRIERRLSKLDFTGELESAGLPYSEGDTDGRVIRRTPKPGPR